MASAPCSVAEPPHLRRGLTARAWAATAKTSLLPIIKEKNPVTKYVRYLRRLSAAFGWRYVASVMLW
jgi:hypothetical protein